MKLQIYVHFGTISGGSRVFAQSCAKLREVKEILDLLLMDLLKTFIMNKLKKFERGNLTKIFLQF